jgi:flagellar motor protein MotB
VAWSHSVLPDDDGSYRVEITDEDGVAFPVARQVTQAQAEHLVQRVADQARDSAKPVKVVIRDPYFMAATVIMIKRLRD